MNLTNLHKHVGKFIVDNSPTILTGLGIAGVVTTAFLTGKATFKAADLIAKETEEARRSTGDSNFEFNNKYKAKLIWKLYIPPVGMGVLTITSIIFANRIGTRRAAAMAAAYSMSERAFAEYREKVADHMGKKKESAVRDDIAQDHVARNPVSTNEVIITGAGSVLCYDTITGRYFQSDMETLRKAQNDINHQLLHDMYATLDDFYKIIGLKSTKFSSEVGWTSDNMLELRFSATLSDDSKPCIAIEYSSYPIRDYY